MWPAWSPWGCRSAAVPSSVLAANRRAASARVIARCLSGSYLVSGSCRLPGQPVVGPSFIFAGPPLSCRSVLSGTTSPSSVMV